MQEVETTYELRKFGWWRHIHTWEFLGREEEAVKKLRKQAPTTVPNIIPGKHNMGVTQVGLSLASRIMTLRIQTFFAPMTGTDEKVVMVPVFVKGSSRAVDIGMDWNVPETMKLFFVSRWNFPGGPVETVTGVMPIFYLIAVEYPGPQNQQKTYTLPLPNVYDEGKVCMGSAVLETFDLRKSIFEQQEYALTEFMKSRWNSDLMNEHRSQNSKRMFRFDPKGKCLPPDAVWTTLCKPVNHEAYSFVVKIP